MKPKRCRSRHELICTIFTWMAQATLLLHAAATPPVTDGLILHLDAARQTELRQKAGLPAVLNGNSMDRWLDAGDPSRFAGQPVANRRPVLRVDEQEAFLRFDGRDDFLSLSGPRREAQALTVFLLAAPQSNRGGFSGFFATAAAGENDYTTGLNLDQGPEPTPQLAVLSVESAGSSGFHNLLEPGRNLAADLRFGSFHVFTVRSRPGARGNELFLDGVRLGERARADSPIRLDDLVIGGRSYSNDPGELAHAQGSFHGDIAAVLVYERALSDAERGRVEQALFARTPALNALLSGRTGHALEVLPDAPVVQMLVPGFSVEELPLTMRNLTGVRYRHDGKLVALGYDGRIHLVSDGDGDGREDQSSVFWDKSPLRGPIGLALLPARDPRGDGVFVASKGKVSLILDRDRDGVADEEIIVAQGWREIPQNVDAVGLAVDPRDGSIYFGLGTANFANGYLLDAGGRSAYDLRSDRGTIQRVSPDFSTRAIVATGVRFTCALAFNRAGDLFATEQEGATWLPNGNALDELLHIRPGLHYGFPPRHPRHLPQVIDEPAVFEYGPQHQSVVGFAFNEGVHGGPSFGPDFWNGDALLCGEARGKLYRTKLVKTLEGYVAQNQIIACLGMLLVDTCVTPRGDLLLACHSGPPDWGTGPAGEGKIFRIRYTGRETPQPVLAWASALDEVRIGFDRALRDTDWAGVKDKIRIEAGQHVSAGDRFEVIRPGYQIVREQMTAPRRWIDLHSLSLSADRRTLILRVPAQTELTGYAVTLPVPASWRTDSAIVQKPEMDLAFTLHGLQAGLVSGGQSNRIVLPHPSLNVSRALTAGSASHEEFFRLADETASSASSLTFRAGLDVGNLFVPAIQPGSTLDWDVANDAFASRRMAVRQDYSPTMPTELPVTAPPESTAAPLSVSFRGPWNANGSGFSFALDERVRPIPLNRFLLPWATNAPSAESGSARLVRTDVQGNWLHGRRLFFGEAGCATCHRIRGEGTVFGPDLSNLVARDRDSVLQDILLPSATINPDVTGSTVTFKDGTEISGLVETLTEETIRLRLPANAHLERPRRDVARVEAMRHSLMPDATALNLSPGQMEDLLTFLLTNPLEPTRITRLDPPLPPARSAAEVAPLLPPAPAAPGAGTPLRILLCVDEKDHGLDEHDYPLWLERWSRLLALADDVSVETARVFPTREQFARADVAVFYSRNSGWNEDKGALLDEFQRRGGGVVLLHWAMGGGEEARSYADRVGLATGRGSKYRHGAMELNFLPTGHPITAGFARLQLTDETYWAFHGDESRVHPLATGVEEGAPRTQLWTFEHLGGRVFGSIPGHYMWTFDDPLYRVIVLRGIAWAARQTDVNRLLELAPVGARMTE